MKTIAITALSLLVVLTVCHPDANAQPPREDGEGFRSRGDRGGFGGRGGFGRRGSGERSGFGGPGGEGRGPGGFGSRLDQNGDGRIDQNELSQMPEGFRNAMESRGIKLQAGLTVEEFGSSLRQQFERRRMEEGGSSSIGIRPLDRREESPTANRSEYKPPSPFRQREKERVTVDLPPKYSEFDTDFDGQIGLYEWITTRRDDLHLFDEIDMNLDGILTPRELELYDEVSVSGEPKLASYQEKYKRPRVTIVGGPAATPSASSGKSKLSKEVKQKHAEFASTKAFPYVDVNKDGRITMEELQRDEKTKRIIPMFEKAGIKIGRNPMSEKEFTKKWIQAQEVFAAMREKSEDDNQRRER